MRLPLYEPAGAVAESSGGRLKKLLVNRKIRDAAFRQNVCTAYKDKCAVTRLKIINGGRRAEVQAAHIMPVAVGGTARYMLGTNLKFLIAF